MSDFSGSHKRHHEYSYRLPTPPRIVVPPPTVTNELPELSVAATNPSDEAIDTAFLKELDLENIIQRNTLLEWSYERRRQAQVILPWLYLGPLTAAKDQAFLLSEGITMVLAVRSRENTMNGAIQASRSVCREVYTVEAPSYAVLIRNFPSTAKMINRHIARMHKSTAATGNPQLGKVLVFCESGNEKSAAVVAAYLMELLNDFDHIKSMQVCQAQRFCVNFDDSVKNILRAYWDILQAKRAVHHSRTVLLQPIPPSDGLREIVGRYQNRQVPEMKQKRTIDHTMEEEDDMEMGDGHDPPDVLRFIGRDNTPFQDS